MKFYVVKTSDKRYDYVAQMLKKDGHELVEDLGWADAAVLPMLACRDGVHVTGTEINFDEFVSQMKEGAVILGGLNRQAARPALDYHVDPGLRYLNAIPTAEGAVLEAMQNLPRTVWNSRCLVIGRGHVGSALASLLKGMGAKVTMAARKPVDLAYAQACGYEAVKTSDIASVIGGQDMIFNAVPARLLGESEMKLIREDALVIDLATTADAIDMAIAEELGVKVIVGQSLPGRYSPETAGRIITDAIYRTMEENGMMK